MTNPLLFTPLTLRGLTLKNRIVVSPMCQYLAVDGYVQDWHQQHHARFALAGYGLAFVEATGVTRDGRITHGCTGIWEDGQIDGLKRIVDGYKAHGVATAIQIGHSGRRGSCARPWDGAAPITAESDEPAWQAVGPSALPERDGYPVPHELTEAEINELVDAFVAATERCLAAGFDIVEIHGAHGYLIHSFFSPASNHRTDRFGGDLANRMRFPLMVAEAVRAAWPEDRPLFYRASSVDNVPGGLPIEDTVALAAELKTKGVDVIDCSSGGMGGPATLATTKLKQGYPGALRRCRSERSGYCDHGGRVDHGAGIRRGDPSGGQGGSRLACPRNHGRSELALSRRLCAWPAEALRRAAALLRLLPGTPRGGSGRLDRVLINASPFIQAG